MANLYQHTKFEANIFISDRYIAKNRKFNLAAAAILNFGKSGIWGNNIADMVNVYQRAKFEVNIFINDRDMEKNPRSKMAAAAILNFRKNVFLYKLHLYGECRSAHEIWWKSAQKWLRYTCLYISKMASVSHLGIIFSSFWTSHDVNFGGLHFSCQWRNDPVESG